MKLSVALERLAILVASLALSFGLIALLSGFFAGRDQASVSAATPAPGQHYRDQGFARLKPAQPRPVYDSNPPTSGPHVPAPVRRDGTQLTDDQLIEALGRGNVVLIYGTPAPPPGLKALASQTAGPFTPSLAAAGQAVILARRPGTTGVLGVAWTHILRVAGPRNPLLRRFIEYWLGRGAPGR